MYGRRGLYRLDLARQPLPVMWKTCCESVEPVEPGPHRDRISSFDSSGVIASYWKGRAVPERRILADRARRRCAVAGDGGGGAEARDGTARLIAPRMKEGVPTSPTAL